MAVIFIEAVIVARIIIMGAIASSSWFFLIINHKRSKSKQNIFYYDISNYGCHHRSSWLVIIGVILIVPQDQDKTPKLRPPSLTLTSVPFLSHLDWVLFHQHCHQCLYFLPHTFRKNMRKEEDVATWDSVYKWEYLSRTGCFILTPMSYWTRT